MERPAAALLPLGCLLLGSLRAWPGAGAQVDGSLQVLQSPEKVSVSVGKTLTLNCTVPASKVIGPVKWLKDSGGKNETVYDEKGSWPRVTRVLGGSGTNYDIGISNMQVEDAGTYYCVKFKKGDQGDEALLSGKGTKVLVNASPVAVAVSGPAERAGPGTLANFTCSARGFFPGAVGVRWLKDGVPLPAPPPRVEAERPGASFAMSSGVRVPLARGDVRARLVCEVTHATLSAPLRGTYELGAALRVPPALRLLATPAAAVELNATVTLSCAAEGFYPGAATLTWLEDGRELPREPARPAPTAQGTFELRSSLALRAAAERNRSVVACRVEHDGQRPVSRSVTLLVTLPPAPRGPDDGARGYLTFIYIAVGVICTVLALLVVAVLYLIRVKQSKGKSSPSVRLHEPEKSSGAAMQEPDANNLTYADLNFDKEKKSVRRILELSQQSEYACIQTGQAPAAEDNLTYADLDMVHLSKAPKRPAPRPDEAGSEYASVQVQRK